jgi:hypothetical protein
MPGEIVKTFDTGTSNVSDLLSEAQGVESRPAQRDAPARANAGPQLVNESDPTMNRESGTEMAPILRRYATKNKTLETKTNNWLVAPADNTRHRGV